MTHRHPWKMPAAAGPFADAQPGNTIQTYYWLPVLLAVLVLGPIPAVADDGLVTDLKLGVLEHDVPVLGEQREHGADLNGEVIFASPVSEAALANVDPRWRWMLRPSPNFGVEANTSGYTSQIYLGLVWSVDLDTGGVLWRNHAVFLTMGFGPAFNNGLVHTTSGNRLSLGSHVLFHPSFEIGYRLNPRWSVSAYFDHSSNAGLARDNAGLDNLGLRVGLHF